LKLVIVLNINPSCLQLSETIAFVCVSRPLPLSAMANPDIPSIREVCFQPPTQLQPAWLQSIQSICLSLLLLASFLLMDPQQARADAGRFLSGADYAELKSELASLQPLNGEVKKNLSTVQQQRLADLQVLERSIARSDDRAQLTNKTTHNLGLFARYKKAPIDSPPEFYVLAPGHQSDDDYDFVALLVPQGVSLAWAETGAEAASSRGPRLIRVLEGQALSVRDGSDRVQVATTAPSVQVGTVGSITPDSKSPNSKSANSGSPDSEPAVSYKLSQPPFQVVDKWEPALVLPALSQTALDQEIENAPLD
jgi:hypothetical protein